jgi:hypothetical protein
LKGYWEKITSQGKKHGVLNALLHDKQFDTSLSKFVEDFAGEIAARGLTITIMPSDTYSGFIEVDSPSHVTTTVAHTDQDNEFTPVLPGTILHS